MSHAPGIRRIAPDAGGAPCSRAIGASVVHPACEVRVGAAQRVAERRRRHRSRTACVLPLGLVRQPELPVGRESTRPARGPSQCGAERFRFCEIDPVNRKVVADAPFGRGRLVRKRAGDLAPLRLRDFELRIQKPLVNVTATCASSARCPISLAGLPMVKRPAGHQHNATPDTSRCSPAATPRNDCRPAMDVNGDKATSPAARRIERRDTSGAAAAGLNGLRTANPNPRKPLLSAPPSKRAEGTA